MKKNTNPFIKYFIKLGIALILVIFTHIDSYSEVVVYPSPGDLTGVPNLNQSIDYTVKVNGQSSFVYETLNTWDGDGTASAIRMESKVAFTNFDFKNETVTVEITCNFTINTVTIRPKNDNVAFIINDNTISFTLSKSTYLSVEVNNRLKPLFIFADSLETSPIANLTFGPGIHNIGPKYPLAANQTVYIAGGAVVNGTFTSNGSNLKIIGRGIVNSGSVLRNDWLNDKTFSPLAAVGSGGLTAFTMSGITMVNSPGWHVNAYGTDCSFTNLKCIAWNGMTDGPHLNGTSLMEHCFIFNNDDALITNQKDNNTFRDCVVFKGPYGRPMITWGDNSQSNLLWEDIDIIGNQSPMSVLWAKMFSIITNATGKSIKQNITVRNVRIEGQIATKAGFICIDANGTTAVKNVTFENITTELLRTTAPNTEGTLVAAAGASIDGVHFKCVKMNNNLITSLEQAHIQPIGSVLNVDFDNTCSLTAIQNLIDNRNIKVYSKYNKLQIDFGDLSINNVSLYNCVGMYMKSGKLNEIEISNLPIGVYLVKTEVEGSHYFAKFMKK